MQTFPFAADQLEQYDCLRRYFHRALNEFAHRDGYLLEVNSSERSMTHLLGVYLFREFGEIGLQVDCEYSRHGMEKKQIIAEESVSSGDLNAKSVFPDIIVHKRGEAGPNLLIIEAKKHGQNSGADLKKMKAYLKDDNRPNDLRYMFGLLLSFPENSEGKWILTWFAQGMEDEIDSYELAWQSET